jgi:hypothetical protein
MSMNCHSHRGPLVLIDGTADDDDLHLAAQILARYGQGREAEQVEVTLRDQQGNERNIVVKPLLEDEIPKEWFV